MRSNQVRCGKSCVVMQGCEGSGQFMDKALSADPAVAMPAEYADRLRDIKNCSQAARDLNDKVWTRLKK